MPVIFAADAFQLAFPNTDGCPGCTQLSRLGPNLAPLVLSSEDLSEHSPGCDGWDVTDFIQQARHFRANRR